MYLQAPARQDVFFSKSERDCVGLFRKKHTSLNRNQHGSEIRRRSRVISCVLRRRFSVHYVRMAGRARTSIEVILSGSIVNTPLTLSLPVSQHALCSDIALNVVLQVSRTIVRPRQNVRRRFCLGRRCFGELSTGSVMDIAAWFGPFLTLSMSSSSSWSKQTLSHFTDTIAT